MERIEGYRAGRKSPALTLFACAKSLNGKNRKGDERQEEGKREEKILLVKLFFPRRGFE